jgi:hypothetical protein
MRNKMEKVFTARDIAIAFEERGISPDNFFTAVAGADYGHVAVWEISSGFNVVVYGNAGQTDYAVAIEVEDPAEWLEHTNLSAIDALVERANVRGASSIKEASPDDDGPFFILVTRNYYGPIERSEILVGENIYSPKEFLSYADAEKCVSSLLKGPYCLDHGESGRPDYRIVVE